MNKPARYRDFIDEMVRVCEMGPGQLGATRARAGIWNKSASAEAAPDQHAMNVLLARLTADERETIAKMLAGAAVLGVFETLKTLETFEIAPFENGYEGSPYDGRIHGWQWPERA